MTSLPPDVLARIAPRLEAESNIWLATVRADGRPHLVPIWFVWQEGKVWIATGEGSQKHTNIRREPHVCLALEDGANPLVIEGLAADQTDPATRDRLAPAFVEKYAWDFRVDDEYGFLIAITPIRLLLGR
jgi:PPOX class probable F420-dependent enzyme